jgi:hypothetical protein
MQVLTKDLVIQAYKETGLKPTTGSAQIHDGYCCPIGAVFCYLTGERTVDELSTDKAYTFFRNEFGIDRQFWLGFDGFQHPESDNSNPLFVLGRELRKELLGL